MGSSAKIRWNLGQTPFKYTPPEGAMPPFYVTGDPIDAFNGIAESFEVRRWGLA